MLPGAKEHAQQTCALPKMFSKNNIPSLSIEKNIAEALHKRNMLRIAESIQISPNGRFCSVKFTTTELTQTFCTEGQVISEIITVYFKPDYKPPPPTRNYTFVSFLNVPLETEEKDMNDFVRQYANSVGFTSPHKKLETLNFTLVPECTGAQK